MKNRTVGIDPKLYPAAFLCLLGIVVALIVDKAVGLGILGTGVAAFSVGVAMPAPLVVSEVVDASLRAPRDGVGPDVQPLHSEAGLAAFGVVGLLAVVAGILVLVLAEAFTVGLVLIIAGGLLLLADLLAGRGASL